MRLSVVVGAALLGQVAYANRTTNPPPSAASVSGVVFDSLSMRGLGGATVQLVTSSGAESRSTRTTTDATGHFVFAEVPVGAYLLGFFHPKLDSLGLTSETLRLDVRTDQPMQTQLTVPSGRTIAKTVCGASFVGEASGLLLGYVRGVDNSMPRGGAKVTVRWAEVVIEKGSIRRVVSSLEATSSEVGQFAVCGIPLGTAVLLQASAAVDSSGGFEVTLPPWGLLHRDVFVAPVTRTNVRSLDSLPDVGLLRGNGRLRGKVFGTNRRPIRDARVTVWGTGIETTSNPDGDFSLAGLPGGTHTLEVRAIGFAPTQIAVDIMSNRAEAAEVELAAIAVTLDTVRVTAQRAYASRRLLELERRQRYGMGTVLDANEINKRNPWVLTDLLRSMDGIRMTPGRFSSQVLRMRSPTGFGFCVPEFIVDNVRMVVGEDFPIDAVVPMDDISAVEVYTNMVPTEFYTTKACGVIAITTGGRPPPPPR